MVLVRTTLYVTVIWEISNFLFKLVISRKMNCYGGKLTASRKPSCIIFYKMVVSVGFPSVSRLQGL